MRKLLLLMAAVVLNLSALAQWEHVPIGIPYEHTIMCLASGSGSIFAGVSTANTGAGDGIYSTTDNGETWNFVAMDTTGGGVETWDLLVTGDNIYAATTYFVWISTDFGATWMWPQDIFMHPAATRLAIGNGVLYASTPYLLCYTQNNGLDWDQNPVTPENTTIKDMLFTGNTLFVGTSELSTGDGRIMKTTDHGANWTILHTFPDNFFYSIAIKDNILFAGLQFGIYRSADLGSTWEPCGLDGLGVSSIIINGNCIIAGTNNGVFISTNNGDSWTEKNDGFTPFPQDGNALSISGDYLFLGSLNSSTWRRPVSDILATGEASQGNDSFTLSPNPAKAGFTLSTGKEPLQNAVLRIFSTEGQKLQEIPVRQSVQYVPVNNLNNGLYIVELASDGRSTRQKLVICR